MDDGAVDLTLARLKELEKQVVWAALEKSGGKIYGRDGAAAALRIKPTTLASKMRKFGFLRSQREVTWSLNATVD